MHRAVMISSCASRTVLSVQQPAVLFLPARPALISNCSTSAQCAQRRALCYSVDDAWTDYNRLDIVCQRRLQRLRDRSWTHCWDAYTRRCVTWNQLCAVYSPVGTAAPLSSPALYMRQWLYLPCTTHLRSANFKNHSGDSDQDHRHAIRMCHGIPRSSSVAETLT
ncbi:hypothetical protein MRX96_057268 [Rhipicephalus microplus]